MILLVKDAKSMGQVGGGIVYGSRVINQAAKFRVCCLQFRFLSQSLGSEIVFCFHFQ